MAEESLRDWLRQEPEKRTLTILRPTVIFGERNRGNVYNLLKQISSGRFLQVGNGENVKSMAYVGNVTSFLQHCISIHEPGYRVYNYVDKPDLTMNELVSVVRKKIGKPKSIHKIPYFIGLVGGYWFDMLSWITGKNLRISSVRIKKFCATTQFDSKRVSETDFTPPFTLQEGLERTLHYEFISSSQDSITFETE